jgi:DNA-binding NtrC family response regulator
MNLEHVKMHTKKTKKTKKSPKTVLLVDDEQENLRAYEEILVDLGYHVFVQPDSDSALALLHDGVSVDLIVTDYRMPGKNGLEFVTLLRQMRPSVPVIMITAYGNIETYLNSFSLGVFEYVNKPIHKEEFERIVRKALHDEQGNQATTPD